MRPCEKCLRAAEKALKILLVHCRLTRRDVVQLSVTHPFLQLIHQAEQVVERIHNEQQRLVMIDLESLIDRPFKLNRIALHLRRVNGMFDLTERTQQPAAINLEPVV